MLAALDVISEASKSDPGLSELYSRAREYALIYLLAKERQKGCDGLGEMSNLKDELRTLFDEIIGYCKTKGYPAEAEPYDLDTVADMLKKTSQLD